MTEIVFGTRQIGGPPSYKEISSRKAEEILEYVYQRGIRVFDTAPIYGNGKSEEILGNFLSKNNIRENCTIITKFGFQITENGTSFDFSKRGIYEQLEGSLSRLKTDVIDRYLLHIPQENIDIKDVLETLNTLKINGKILSYGICNTYGKQLSDFIHHPDSEIEYVQDFYNLIERKAEKLIFPYLKGQKFLAYSPLYRGLLTDIHPKKLLEKNEDAIMRVLRYGGIQKLLREKKLYETVAERKGVGLEKLALDFLQNNTQVDAIVFGTTDKKHLEYFLSLMY